MADQQVNIKVRLDAAQNTIDVLENLRNLTQGKEQERIDFLKKDAELVKNALKDPESLTPEALKENDKFLKKIINKTRELNTRISDLPKDAKISIEMWQNEIEKSAEELLNKESALSKLEERFNQQKDGSFLPERGKAFYRKEIEQDVFKAGEKQGVEFKSVITGKDLKTMSAYSEQVEKVESLFDIKDKKQKELLEKIKAGKALNKEDNELLDQVLSKDKKILKNKDIALNMLKNKNKLHKEEQKIIENKFKNDPTIKQLRKEIKMREDNIQKNQEQIDLELEKHSNDLTQRQIDDNNKLNASSGELTENQRKEIQAKKENKKATDGLNNAHKKTNTTLGLAAKQVFNYGLAFNVLRRIYRETIRTITELDKAFTEMAIVTTMNREETWALSDQMFELAKQTGFTATEISKLSTVYFRQGRTLSEVIELTRVAAMAARVAGISAGESADFLTSAVNAFRLSADEALAVSDRFAALAASSASSYQELATGLSKFAAQANVAGIGIDFAMGMLAKGVETTREAPETIGTAIKSVTARMRELSDLGKTFEDGMDINRVETALRQVGVALRDESGQFRNLENVLTDVGMKWETLNKNQQASVAVALAGIRQQSRLIAIMNDFERTQELVSISQESAGATAAQHVQFMNSLQAATTRMQNAYQEFIKTITDSEIIIGIINSIAAIVETFSDGLNNMGLSGKNAMIAILGLATVLKATSVAIAVFSKLAVAAGLSNKVWTLSTIAQTIANKGLIASLKVLFAMLLSNPITVWATLITSALVAVIFIVGRVTTSAERAREKFEKFSKEMKAARYELKRTERNFKELNEEIEKFNNLPFLTTEQSEELNTALEKLSELVGEENVVRIDGEVDLELSQPLIDKWFEEQNEEFEKNLDETFSTTLESLQNRAELVFGDRIEGEGRRESEWNLIDEEATAEEINNISDSLIFEYQKMFGKLTSEQERLMRLFINSTDFSTIDVSSFLTPEQFLKENFSNAFQEIKRFEKEFENKGTLKEKVESFNEALKGVADETTRNFIKERFADLSFIADQNIDLEILEKLGLNSTDEVQKFSKIFGDSVGKGIQDIYNRAEEISNETGFGIENAIKLAWTELAEETNNAELSAFAYSQAIEKTSLEVAQGLDTIINRLKSVNEQQEKILEGTASAEEIYNFIEGNADLFESVEDITAFLSGKSIDSKIFAQRIKAEEEAVVDLTTAMVTLNDENATTEERNAAIKQFAMASALLEYNGVLKKVTESQYRYNESLESYETLTSLGLDTTKLSNRILQDQLHIIDRAGQSIVDQVNTTKESFNDLKETLQAEDAGVEQILTGNFEDYIVFDDISKKFIPVYDSLDGLSSSTIQTLTEYTEELNESINGSLKIFKEAREVSLKIEKETIDKQKKIYQDYYTALDKMEQKRNNSQAREEIIEQISRLEGATDQASRQKALQLQKDLNKLNEENAKNITKESRESTLKALDERYKQAEARWAQAGAAFITEFSNAIDDGSTEFSDSVVNNFAEESGLNDLPTNLEITFGTFLDNFQEIIDNLDIGNASSTQLAVLETLKDQWIKDRIDQLSKTVRYGRVSPDILRKQVEAEAEAKYGFAKGGMVNFTGPAMLHGSKSNPEAVLNPEQTKMFMGLRNILEKVSIDSNKNSSSISIENISISTDSLNTNQDFANAGETLAKAFSKAIQRKGVTVNTKR